MADLSKPIRRRTNTLQQGRRLVVEIRPGIVGTSHLATDTLFIREEGRRRGYSVPVVKIYQLGARLEAEQSLKDRKAKRKARKLAKG